MATAPTPMTPGQGPRTDEQLRRDRFSLVVILAVFAALLALMFALTSSGILPTGGEWSDPWIMP